MQRHPTSVPKKNLHLVVQKGRLFQRHYPEVEVLLDKGRYLVVSLDPQRASRLKAPAGPCFRIERLPFNEVVFDVRPAVPSARRAPEPWVEELANELSRFPLEASLQHLVAFLTRFSTSPAYGAAAEWCQDQLLSWGYEASLEPIRVGSGSSSNVIGTRQGVGPEPRELVLVVAHLDSVNLAGGAAALAPGADDNGSGSAGLLEMARVLQDHSAVHDLRFVLFGGEEQGLHGSLQHVAALTAEDRARITAVVNMDMIGRLNTQEPTVLLEGATLSQSVLSGLSSAAADYTGLAVQTSLNPFASDHVPFLDADLPAVLTIEGADSANSDIHTDNDLVFNIDYALMLEILRMNVAYVASALGQAEGEVAMVPGVRRQVSGRYQLNGGAEAGAGDGGRRIGISTVHDLESPIYLDEPPVDRVSRDELTRLRFTLNVDIDGTDPLNVVSGTVCQGLASCSHFIGQVSADSGSGGTERDLLVENFSFDWPATGEAVVRLQISLSADGDAAPTARVTFISAAGRTFGPFVVQQESTYFHDVELEIDREDGAASVEPFASHAHPDRPADYPAETLTLEAAFAKSGIGITRSPGANVIDTSAAGPNSRWNVQELHDAMELNWSAFANQPQWKMWIFLAQLADRDGLGGIMFDGDIDEPGGVDRQGTAIFTRSPFFHTEAGAYCQANPPAREAAIRELFFNLMHETGHAFNLAHSFQKALGASWDAPPWMPVVPDPQALSWMNYPDQASPGLSAKWFYDRFRFRFDDNENLFLRHAPSRSVQMGNETWFQDHGRVTRRSLNRRLELVIRTRKTIVELGEPLAAELRLKNLSGRPVAVHRNLDLADGYVQLAVTNPRGERRPFLPIFHTRQLVEPRVLEPGEALYQNVSLNIGGFGSPFKEPGAYRVEAAFVNLDGSTAAAVMQVYVRPPASWEDLAQVNELFNARVGRVLYVGGTRVMADVIARLDHVSKRLGPRHPAQYHLQVALSGAFDEPFKVVEPEAKRVRLLESDPELVERELRPVVADSAMERAADTIGHIRYERVMETYTDCAVRAKKRAEARRAQSRMLSLFEARKVVPTALERAERRLERLS